MSEYLELHPARAKTKSVDELWGSVEHVQEEKYDGWRFLYHFGGRCRRVYMTGRRESDVTGKLSEKGSLVPELHLVNLADIGYSVLDGEVLPPIGAKFEDMASFMNASPDVVKAQIKKLGPPRFVVFDSLFFNGNDIREKSQMERKATAKTLVDFVTNQLVTLAPTLPMTQEAYEEVVDRGGEGTIIKNIFSPYGEGWIKAKKYVTLDVVISGFKPGKGKYVGQVGAAIVSVFGSSGELLEIGKVSGMTDETRLMMTLKPGEWIGKVIEVRAQGWAKERLRHPRFKRSRPDANPRECTWAKIKEEMKIAIAEDESGPQMTLRV